jgi:sn-glycerol 3-phosphate transport system permease protein
MTTATRDRAVRTGPPKPVGPPPKRSGVGWREWLLAGALLLPNLVLLVLFTYRPLLDNIRLSFTDWNISAPFAD